LRAELRLILVLGHKSRSTPLGFIGNIRARAQGWISVTAFGKIPFFQGLASAQAESYAHKCAWKRFQEHELVLDFDDRSSDVYFIVSGDVRVLVRTPAGKEVILCDLNAGEFFGEMAAIDGAERSANVTALTNVELCIMPASVFKSIVFSSPTVCERLLTLLTHRIRDLNARLFERSVLDLRHRLYAELLRLAAPRKGFEGQMIISPPPLQHDLAARIGCRREQVSREIHAMIEEGSVEKIRGGLVLLRPSMLEKRISNCLEKAD
jgi:CRP/FNR family cyclic AMP-dependent transcriptional regulator